MEIFNKTNLKKKRQYLRNNATSAESLLWEELRKRKLLDLKFRRQYSVNKYILDFYCPEKHLAVELDGEVHISQERKIQDKIRNQYLLTVGIKTIRFKNEMILENVNSVVEIIKSEILNLRT